MLDVEALVRAMTLEEKAALTAGEDFFSTPAVERLGIPKVRLTDGPNGARGTDSFPGMGGTPSTVTPCGSALGASWDPDLAREVGALLGREARDRGCRVLLAPTVNLHRHPFAGRNFECFSEDPLLSGHLAVGYVQGVQSEGVVATVKHFVGNDAEHERMSISSEIDARSLRELYLLPFEMAVRAGGALGVMTAYNRLNGRWLTQQPDLLDGLLRQEWGFEGLVMTDWFAAAFSDESLAAGLDLEMPGPGRALGASLVAAVREGRVPEADLDTAVGRLLRTWDRIGALAEPTPPVSHQPTRPEDAVLLRRAAAEATVLLANDGILPLQREELRRVAVLGPHAADPRIMGGGSAQVVLHAEPDLLGPLAAALPGVELVHRRGAEAELDARLLGRGLLPAPDGFAVEVFPDTDLSGEGQPRPGLDELRLLVFTSLRQGWPEGEFALRVRGTVVPEVTQPVELRLAQAGRARVLVDGQVVLDGFAEPMPPGGHDFFGMASQDAVALVDVVAGRPLDVVVEYAKVDAVLAGFRLGYRLTDPEPLLQAAVEAARDADAALLFVGTTEEWETETSDRTTLALPGAQDELVRRVAAVNPRTVVVVNAGAPVELPWADDVAAVLQCWFGGQEMPGGLVDVLLGEAEPGGRLPTTLPRRVEHSPSHDNFPGENGVLRYGEGLFMGYRGYDHRRIEPRFPFGHGLSYTTFSLGRATLSATQVRDGEDLAVAVRVPVTNTGTRSGSTVVQCYVAPGQSRLARPPKELKAFRKVRLAPGESTVVELELDRRAFAHWDPGPADGQPARGAVPAGTAAIHRPTDSDVREPGWYVDPGHYDVLVGQSSALLEQRCVLEVRPR